MKPVSFHRLALKELFAASDYYDAERKGLGSLFLAAVEATVAKIKESPQAGAPSPDGVCRKWAVRGFKHRVIYLEMPAFIRIVAVAHPSRRPVYWRRRMNED